jgi:leader peptidase (prepilin peptidase)/N-methyltransferase
MSVSWPALALIGVLGLAIGSFLNVVVYRVPREESLLYPPSHCPKCDQPIKALHNIPVVSWLVLRGRCANCHERISARYPIVEIGTAALFVGMTLRFRLSAELPAYLYLAAIALVLLLIDLDVQRLPDSIVLPSYIVTVLLLMPAGAVSSDWWPAVRALVGMLALWAVYFAFALAYPNGIGLGEVKLAGLLGLYLGWLSWSAVLIGTFGGFLLGGFLGAALIALGHTGRQTIVPFGAALVVGAVLAVFVAPPITHWYNTLLAAGLPA